MHRTQEITFLSKYVLAVGISQRTDAASIERLLVNIFERGLGFK